MTFEQILAQLAVVATVVKKATDLVKPLYDGQVWQDIADQFVALVISIALCLSWDLNLLDAAGIVLNPIVGEAATGFVAALGASVLHDVVELLRLLKEKNTPASE